MNSAENLWWLPYPSNGIRETTLGKVKLCCLSVFLMIPFQRCQRKKSSSSQNFEEVKHFF